VVGHVALSGQPEIVPNMEEDPRAVHVAGTPKEPETMMALPLVAKGTVLGVLAIYRPAHRTFYPEELELARLFVSQAASAVENARLYEEEQRRRRELASVQATAAAISAVLDRDALLRLITQKAAEVFDAPATSLMLWNEDQTALNIQASWGLSETYARQQRIPHQRVQAILQPNGSASPFVVPDLQRAPFGQLELVIREDLRSVLTAPLFVGGRLIGALNIYSKGQPRAFSDDDVELACIFADQAAIAIENARLYAQIQQDVEDLRKLDELKSDFVAVVSHELRAPLTSIISYGETLLQGRVGHLVPQQQHAIEVICQSAHEQLRIVDDLLDLSRLEAGRMTLHVEEVPLASVVDEALQTAVPMAESKKQHLVNQVSADLPLVRADPNRVRQILLNLITNGIKFTPAEGRIAITAEVIANELQVAVRDTGIGIAPEHQHLIFDKFTQVERPLTRQYPGAGLGLPIARLLVELHGGRIWVESAPGQGSTFYFTLPLANRRIYHQTSSLGNAGLTRGCHT